MYSSIAADKFIVSLTESWYNIIREYLRRKYLERGEVDANKGTEYYYGICKKSKTVAWKSVV